MIGFIIGIVIFIAIMWLGLKRQKEQAARDQANGVTARFRDLAITATHLLDGTQRHALAGLTARVEDAGQLNRRITATRIVTTGVFALAWRKRQDDRSVFLTIEGPGVAVLRELAVKKHPQAPVQARAFAAKVNAAAGALGAAPTAEPARPALADGDSVAGHLAELGRMHAAGQLADEEFAAAKARLLGQPQDRRE